MHFSFGQRIEPEWWSTIHQRVMTTRLKRAGDTDERKIDKRTPLNQLLDVLADTCESAYKQELPNGLPSPDTLKLYLQAVIDQNKPPKEENTPTLLKLVDRFISGEIKFKGKKKAQKTLDGYKYFKKHLLSFQAAKRINIDYDTISLDFFYKFTSTWLMI